MQQALLHTMKDDPEFNIHFVGLVEGSPCIYDFTCVDYSNRCAQDKAWERLARELSESVDNCKERWKI